MVRKLVEAYLNAKAIADWLIWQILYPIIAVTLGFVFVQALRSKVSSWAAASFAINLAANLAFTPIQFGMRNLTLAAADILVVLGTII